jgi:hypothetical protein
MYKVEWLGVSGVDKSLDFSNLDQAMEFSRTLGCFVKIKGGEFDIVGKFGVDSIKAGTLPDGSDYTWKKRR